MKKSGPKKQTTKKPFDQAAWNKHRNKQESRAFWKRERLIEKREIQKEAEE